MSDEKPTPETNGKVDKPAASEETKVDTKAAAEEKATKMFASEKKPDAPKEEAKSEAAPDKSDEKAPDKPSEKPDEKLPEKYDLKLPEDTLLDKARLDEIATYAREQGLSQTQAQAAVERESKVVRTYQDQLVANHQKLVDETWPSETKADKEVGGDNLAKSAELSRRILDAYGSEKFKQMLVDTGYGNNVEVMRFFARAGKAFEDAKIHLPGAPSVKGKTREERFYGASEKQT